MDEEVTTIISHFPTDMELVITEVKREPRQKYRYLISFESYDLSVHEDVMIKYRMVKGNTFWRHELEEIILSDEKQRGYVHALKYLERKARTCKEIATRLREKETSPAVIEEVLERLSRDGLVNDALYAQQWTEQRIKRQRKGKLWISQELRQKGVEKTLIVEALDSVSSEDEFESAFIIGRKKWSQTKGETLDKKRKTGSYLMRRGFTGDLVRRVLNCIIQDEDEQVEEDDDYTFE
ncbi:regulatory protein RecX [Paenibacillus sp. CMAA1364]